MYSLRLYCCCLGGAGRRHLEQYQGGCLCLPVAVQEVGGPGFWPCKQQVQTYICHVLRDSAHQVALAFGRTGECFL
jgi:hypothetical protein